MKRLTLGLATLFGAFALAACGDSEPAEAPATLTRVVAEQPGKNCEAGGQAIQLGTDANGTGVLDADEVTGTSYVCNGVATKAEVEVATIPVGDPRCPNGGTAMKVAGSKEVVACNGATGAQGAQGSQGAQGAQGDAGAQGNAAPETVLGQFLPSQVAKGAVLTCGTNTSTATTVGCQGMKVNGLDVKLAPVEANAICSAITGKGYDTAGGSGSITGPFIVWTSGAWAIQPTGSTSPMQNLICKR